MKLLFGHKLPGLVLFALLLPASVFAQPISLFNGEDLTGWRVHGTEKWYVENGELICESGPDAEYGYLATEQVFKNFDLTVDFKQEANGNSGIFFRSSLEGTIITGWQAEVAPPDNDTGGVYESYGRGWLVKPDKALDKALNMGEWNTMRIRVVEDHVQTWVNGVPMVDFKDEKIGEAEGSIALQIHDGGGIKVRWRNLMIEEVEADETTGSYLYITELIRATPGKLLPLIDALKAKAAYYESAGLSAPYIMRHSQGDHWDLMLLHPVESYATYFSPANMAARVAAQKKHGIDEAREMDMIAWRERTFVQGPSVDIVADRFEGMSFFHIEIFTALPDKRQELLMQRKMENKYLEGIDRQQNLIFQKDMGGAWDQYTLGFYRDIKHFAESADIPIEKEDEAARAAGFQSVYTIGSYLRSLIAEHHDTLATAVR